MTILARRKVELSDLTNRLIFGDDFLDTEVCFELYRWMMSSAGERGRKWAKVDNYSHMRYRAVVDSIGSSKHSRDLDGFKPEPFGVTWARDIRERLLHALRDGGGVAQWRREQDIPSAGSKIITGPFRRYMDGRDLDRLFALAAPERRTLKSYNSVHPDARGVDAIWLCLTDVAKRAPMWSAVMRYRGLASGGVWIGPSVDQRKGEPFPDFICRATKELDALLTPACRPLLHRLNGSVPPRLRTKACTASGLAADEGFHPRGAQEACEP